MRNGISTKELLRIEAKCNALLGLQEDYQHLIRSLEENYGVRIHERHIRRIVGGSAGPEQIVLEKDEQQPYRHVRRSP
jgi:hypothetical protein